MAKISYLISKNAKHSGKHIFHFDGSGSGSFFQKWFNKDHDEINSNPTDLKDLISKLVSEFDGDSETIAETRIEFEGSCEDIKEFASWSISEIKANGEFLKDLAQFAKTYCESLCESAIKMYRGFKDSNKISEENSELRKENDELKATKKKAGKTDE